MSLYDCSEEVQFQPRQDDARHTIVRDRVAKSSECRAARAHPMPPIVRQHHRIRSWTFAGFCKSTGRAKATATYSSFISVSSLNPDCRSKARNLETACWTKYLACLATSSVPKSS